MADSFQLEVATPERLLIRASVTEAQIPAASGMIGVLPDHAAFLGELGTGELSYTELQARKTVFISGGWIQILNNEVRVMAERAEHPDEIDMKRAEAALKRARERLALPASAGVDVARAINAMKRAEARLAIKRVGSTI